MRTVCDVLQGSLPSPVDARFAPAALQVRIRAAGPGPLAQRIRLRLHVGGLEQLAHEAQEELAFLRRRHRQPLSERRVVPPVHHVHERQRLDLLGEVEVSVEIRGEVVERVPTVLIGHGEEIDQLGELVDQSPPEPSHGIRGQVRRL